MKDIAVKIATIFTILVFLFFGFKSCVSKIWMSPERPTTYAIHGSDGRSLLMIFLPKNETILLYLEAKAEFMEAALTQMRGTYGTHYLWRLWQLEGPNIGEGWFGLRIFPEGVEPVVMETTILKKFSRGSLKSSFRKEGDISHIVILFSENAVRFNDMWLVKEYTNLELVKALMGQLKPR